MRYRELESQLRIYATNEERTDMEGIIPMYGERNIFHYYFRSGRNRCKQGQLDWDMAIGMAARGA